MRRDASSPTLSSYNTNLQLKSLKKALSLEYGSIILHVSSNVSILLFK